MRLCDEPRVYHTRRRRAMRRLYRQYEPKVPEQQTRRRVLKDVQVSLLYVFCALHDVYYESHLFIRQRKPPAFQSSKTRTPRAEQLTAGKRRHKRRRSRQNGAAPEDRVWRFRPRQ